MARVGVMYDVGTADVWLLRACVMAALWLLHWLDGGVQSGEEFAE